MANELEKKDGEEVNSKPVPSREVILKLSEIRKKKKVSTYKLAELTGIRQSDVFQILTGKEATSIDLLARIADALGYKITVTKIRERKIKADG